MKFCARQFLVLFLLLSLTVSACAFSEKDEIKKAVALVLDPLKDFDSADIYDYLAQTDIFPGDHADIQDESAIRDTFMLFYRDFAYKVREINLHENEDTSEGPVPADTAEAVVELNVPDGRRIAEDLIKEELTRRILQQASEKVSSDTAHASFPLQERFQLLYSLLSDNTYKTTVKKTEIKLQKSGDSWQVERTHALGDALTGGLSRSLTDPELLSPSQTLELYLTAITKMSPEQLESYLELESFAGYGEVEDERITLALIGQIRQFFSCSVSDAQIKGYQATVPVKIRTFDKDRIMTRFYEKADRYLQTADAVIDGLSGRTDTMRDLMVEAIETNTEAVWRDASFSMINDGTGWQPADGGHVLGEALLGLA